jgi:NAD(P)-dependent dehydrogenase (short-subunit alcohol dehydrogenase family)
MTHASPFADRIMVVSGGSRGIGLAFALGAARHGADVVRLATTADPHPKLPGTVHTAVEMLSRPASDTTGQCYVDSAVLTTAGIGDLSGYGGGPDPIMDIFVDR